MEDDLLERMLHVQLACGDGSAQARLELLLATWLVQASVVRTEALVKPGRFQWERDRQVDLLRYCADLIAADTPDQVMERLYHEGDIAGMLRHARKSMDDEPPEED